MQPLIIISAPRSGSTLLQRTISSHPQIQTSAEPWLALPLANSLIDDGYISPYNRVATVHATRKSLQQRGVPLSTVYKEYGAALTRIYEQLAGDHASIFLDKTPRYAAYLPQLRQLLPEARYIILLRNPVDILCSISSSLNGGKWHPERYRLDLVQGLRTIAHDVDTSHDNTLVIHYERLLADPPSTTREIALLMGWEADWFRGHLAPRQPGFGDRGAKQRSDLIQSRKSSSISIIRNEYRRRYALHFVQELGREAFDALGYDYHENLRRIREVDIPALTYGWMDMATTLVDRGEAALVKMLHRRLARRTLSIEDHAQASNADL